jgi:energy-coupling factor transporter ATP-binding protein EcfA2
MRIKSLTLAWFRGAADAISLDTNSKSVVIYGENGSGKSSFVDAVEYLINKGKIGHLTHEYSGKHQVKGLLNTHRPSGTKAHVRLLLDDGRELMVEITPTGLSTRTGTAGNETDSWDYHRTVLRQDEVAAFIHNTKGGKYSELLPLLGLHSLEIAAENLRQLAKAVESQGKLQEGRQQLQGLNAARAAAFGDADDASITDTIDTSHSVYCTPGGQASLQEKCTDLVNTIGDRMNASSSEHRTQLLLQSIAGIKLQEHIDSVRTASSELAASVEPLISEKLEVLSAVGPYVQKVSLDGTVRCPACGQSLLAEALSGHVAAEKARLEEISESFERRRANISRISHSVVALKTDIVKPDLASWRAALPSPLKNSLQVLDRVDEAALRLNCDEETLRNLENHLQPFIDSAGAAAAHGPADMREMSKVRISAEAGRHLGEAKALQASIERIETLIRFIKALETAVRQQIRSRSQLVIDNISADIQGMWSVLNPGAAIEGVKLYISEDADKAIDVQLKFHGVSQDSPRLTLSEGYRNSLGLCIFLSMAKREAAKDLPLFLDDVVVSLDRNHRGMIVELLEKEFAGRQVILLTHDREWYSELRHQLDGTNWTTKALVPYATPDIGIRWSSKSSSFEDARVLLQSAPDAAGNTVRKIMDLELAVLAERLRIKVPYLHGYKNDHRTGQDFLSRIIAEGAKCFQRKGADYEIHTEALEGFMQAQKLLLSWGNRASHTFDVVTSEAAKLLASCEHALNFLVCSSCKKPVHRLDDTSAEFLQCQCGHLRWRYGKR